jgi:hypothetical protein
MNLAFAKLGVAILATALLVQSCYAQTPGGGRKPLQQDKKTDKPSQAPKADEKAYNAALKNLPNKPFDPWHGAR